jgi:hypothetical protein
MFVELTDKEKVVEALRGPQFGRKVHGSLYDRGAADSYYSRPRDPHYYPEGSYRGPRVTDLNPEEIAAYNYGYDWNEQYGDKKSWD